MALLGFLVGSAMTGGSSETNVTQAYYESSETKEAARLSAMRMRQDLRDRGVCPVCESKLTGGLCEKCRTRARLAQERRERAEAEKRRARQAEEDRLACEREKIRKLRVRFRRGICPLHENTPPEEPCVACQRDRAMFIKERTYTTFLMCCVMPIFIVVFAGAWSLLVFSMATTVNRAY